MMKRLEFVERGLVEDVEPGALVYSTSVFYGNNLPAGGIVTSIDDVDRDTGELVEDPTVNVIRWNYRPTSPYLWSMPRSDIDAGTMTFFTRACDIEAQALQKWLGTLKRHDRTANAHWRHIAEGLAAMADTGAYTLRAQRRYDEGSAARRAEYRASLAPVIDVESRAAELMPKLEEAINDARRRQA